MSVKGREVNLINLLRDFEALPMYTVVEAVSYATQRDDEGLTSFSIVLRVYDIDNDKFYK